MNSRERLQAVFNNRAPDRVPIWLMFPFESEPIAADVNHLECYREAAGVVRRHQDYIERNTVNTDFLGVEKASNTVDFLFNHPEVNRKREERITGKGKLICDRIRFKDIEFERTETTPYLKDIGDLKKLMALPYDIPEIDMDFYRQRAENLGDRGLHGILIIDPISVLHDICGETDFTIWTFTDTGSIREFLDFITPRMFAIYEQFLKQGVGETFFIGGPEFIGPPLGSPKLFHELVTMYDRPLIDLIRSYGKKSILHCHGKTRDILEEMAVMAPDALHPIEPPPMGDCTLTQAREALGERTVLVGNIEYSDLAVKEPGDIEQLVEQAIDEGGPENFILCPSCSPYETDITKRISENYIAMIEAGLKYGRLTAGD